MPTSISCWRSTSPRWMPTTLLEVTRRWEVQERRLGAVRHRLVAELESQGLATRAGSPRHGALLQELWNAAPAVARREVALAAELAPRRGLDRGGVGADLRGHRRGRGRG